MSLGQTFASLNIGAGASPGFPVVSNIFGVVLPGRPVLYEWSQVDATHLTIDVARPSPVGDLTLFLLPGAALQPGSGAALYWSTPPYDLWNLLGAVTEAVPSATVRTGWSKLGECPSVRLGIALESLETLDNLQRSKAISTLAERADWGRKLAQDLHNYMASFEENERMARQLSGWLQRFERKYALDPNFMLKES